MKIHVVRLVAALFVLLCLSGRLFAQGSLTPPAGPAPTMKTLAQIEPRSPISALPFVITNSGAYYLTTNLTGISGSDGIIVQADNVDLDLSGFALIGVAGSGNGVDVTTN